MVITKLWFSGPKSRSVNIFFQVLAHFPGIRILLPEMKPRNNIVYQIQYLTMSLILDLQENIYEKVKITCSKATKNIINIKIFEIRKYLVVFRLIYIHSDHFMLQIRQESSPGLIRLALGGGFGLSLALSQGDSYDGMQSSQPVPTYPARTAVPFSSLSFLPHHPYRRPRSLH